MGFPRPVYCWVLAHIDLRSLARLGGTCSSARELLGTAGHPELTMRRRAFELDIARAREGSSLVGFAFSPPAPPSPWRGVFSPLVAWAEQRWRQPRLLTCAVVGPSAAGKSSVVFNAMRRPHHWAVPTIGGVIESVDDAASTGRRLVLHELPARLYREGLQLSGGVASFVRAGKHWRSRSASSPSVSSPSLSPSKRAKRSLSHSICAAESPPSAISLRTP